MAIPGPGTAISMTTIATEFGGTVPHSLSEYYRGGGLVPNTPNNATIPTSGQIAMGDFYGTANRTAYTLTIGSNTYNYDVYTNRGPLYVAGASDITVTVNPGVTVGSTSTGTYAMLVPSAFNPGDTVRIVNNGVIQGMGGAGGAGGAAVAPTASPGSPGGTGGNAIYVNRPTVITNNGVVAGGGGGGGGGGGRSFFSGPPQKGGPYRQGGAGGGGGAGFNAGGGGGGGPATNPGTAFNPGAPGSPGTSTTGGAGGTPVNSAGGGGAGGARGASGSPGILNSGAAVGAGASTGNYIVGNPFVTWPATGTRQGGVA